LKKLVGALLGLAVTGSLAQVVGHATERFVAANPATDVTELGIYSEDGRWRLAWSDEFDGGVGPGFHNGLDLSTWEIQTGNGGAMGIPGWGNGEIQYYHEDNVWVEDGMLHIEARLEENGIGSPAEGFWRHSSGRIRSVGTDGYREAFGHGKSVLYGRIEARISLPLGEGLWPAFWMMPTYDVYGTWAASGEIDIMEARGREPHYATAAIHYGGMWPHNTHSHAYYHLGDDRTIEDFILYSVEWEPGVMRFMVDDHVFWEVSDWHALVPGQEHMGTPFMWPAPFDQYFHMILNLAIGGWFDGGLEPDDALFDQPILKRVDYVRVWEYTGEFEEPTPPVIEPEDIPAGATPEVAPGGLIRDVNFENVIRYAPLPGQEGFPTRYGWELFAGDFGGVISGYNRVNGGIDIQIGAAGGPVHANQLMQRVPLVRGRHYRLSFDAHAGGPRSMNVRLSQGANPGWVAYSDFNPNLTVNTQNFVHYFTMSQATNLDARLEFNMGGNASDIWIGNVQLVEVDYVPEGTDLLKLPLGDGNMIWNGSFDQGRDGFIFWNRVEGPAELYIHRFRRQLEVSNVGAGLVAQDVALTQSRIPFANDDFRLTFAAQGEGTLGFRVVHQDGGAVFYESTFALATDKTDFDLEFSLTGVPGNNREMEVQFLFGHADNVILDEVRLERLTDTDRDFTGITMHPLVNGDFFNGLSNWTQVSTGGGLVNTTVNNGVAIASVTGLGTQPWGAMIMNEGLQVHSGFTYAVQFDIAAENPRNIQLVVETPAFLRRLEPIIPVTTETVTHRFEFNSLHNEILDLKFLMGAMDGAALGNVSISNVQFYIVGAPYERIPTFRVNPVELGNDGILVYHQASNPAFSETEIEVLVNGQPAIFNHIHGEIVLGAENFNTVGTYRVEIGAPGFEGILLQKSVLERGPDAPICEPSRDGLLVNGNFTCELVGPEAGWWHPEGMPVFAAPWLAWVNATHTYLPDGGIGIHMAAVGYQPWHIQLNQTLATPISGDYELTFTARATEERLMTVEFAGGNSTTVALTEEWQTFTLPVEAAVQIRFLLGGGEAHGLYAGATSSVYLREVALNEVEDPEEEPTFCEPTGLGLLQNSDFSCPLTGPEAGWWYGGNPLFVTWQAWVNATHRYTDEGLAVDINNGGWLNWHVFLNQSLDGQLPLGNYELSVTARASAPRDMVVEFGAGELQQHEVLPLTEEWQTFTIERPTASHIRLLLGGYVDGGPFIGTVYIREVRLEEVFEEEIPAYEVWDANRVFDSGDRVIWDGRIFEAQWWTQNQEPGTSPWGSWMEIGTPTTVDGNVYATWTDSRVFDSGDIVAYNGQLWRARWWTRNQNPGTIHGPWELIRTIE